MKSKKIISYLLGIPIGILIAIGIVYAGGGESTIAYYASKMSYSGTSSGSSKTNAQDAIDELYSLVATHCPLGYICTKNEDVTATLTYNANGGSGAPSAQTMNFYDAATISSTTPTRTGYTFLGWSTDSSATTATYIVGTTYKETNTVPSNQTLYAVWRQQAGMYDASGNLLSTLSISQIETDYTDYANIATTLGISETSVAKVIIPEGTTRIGTETMYNLTKMTSVDIPESVTIIGNSAFSVTGLTSVTLPNNVTEIEVNAFNGSTSLTSINIPDSLITIGTNAFLGTTALTSISLGSGVTTLGDGSFAMGGLTSITIPSNVKTIGTNAFLNTSSLKSVTLENGIQTIGDGAFSATGITSLTVPSSVTSLGNSTFLNCSSLKTLVINEGITTLGNGVFGNTGLTSVSLPNSLTTMGKDVFYQCTSLTSLTIPSTVTTIGTNAFSSVPHVYYYGTASGSPWGASALN